MRPDTRTIAQRAAAATPGPWHHDDSHLWAVVTTKPHGFGDVLAQRPPSRREDEAETKARMAFIAAAREDVPALCRRVEQLEAAIGRIDLWLGMAEAVGVSGADAMRELARAALEGE